MTRVIYKVKYENISKVDFEWIKEIACEFKCSIVKEEWKSKYNSYVVYDYEPCHIDGFNISITIGSVNSNTLEFISYLYRKRKSDLKIIKNSYELEVQYV